jgi:hypothetical protein
MKELLCINNITDPMFQSGLSFQFILTIGKYYSIMTPSEDADMNLPFMSGPHYFVTNDSGLTRCYPTYLFKPVAEIREDKLNILI